MLRVQMKKLLALLLFAVAAHASGPNVLSNTDHIVSDVQNAITILGGTLGVGGIIVDQTCPTGGAGFHPGSTCGGTNSFVTPGTLFAGYADNLSILQYSAGTASTTNNAPYGILNQSSTGYSLAANDQATYNTLETAAALYVMAYCGFPVAGDYPPIASSTILPSNAGTPETPVNGFGCGWQYGIEFSMTPNYKGFDTSSPSGTTEALSGVFAVLKANHSSWTWGDIKGALRQTASNWSTTYVAENPSPLGFGFGNIDYDTANALSGTGAIFLQGPGFALVNNGYYATLTLYPFVSTRRAKEVIYVGGTWPAASTLNEMTAAQVAAAGGTKIVDDGGATGAQSFIYAPPVTGSATFTAITLDSSGNGSRVESFEQITASFTVGSACL
jgi:hypothetical protein